MESPDLGANPRLTKPRLPLMNTMGVPLDDGVPGWPTGSSPSEL